MFLVKNIIKGKFHVSYGIAVNSFLAINDKDSKLKYFPIKFFNNKDETEFLLQICKIGECFDTLVKKGRNSKSRNTIDKHKVTYQGVYSFVKDVKKKEEKYLYTNLLYSIYVDISLSFENDITISPPIRRKEESLCIGDALFDYIDNTKNDKYINNLIDEILNILENKKGISIEYNSIDIAPFIFDYDIKKIIFNNFDGLRKEYRDFLRSMNKLFNKFGLPIMPSLEKHTCNYKTVDFNGILINIEEISNIPEKLNHTYDNQVYFSWDGIDIKCLEINLNDFIIECYYIYHLFNINHRLLKDDFETIEDKQDYAVDTFEQIFSNRYEFDFDKLFSLYDDDIVDDDDKYKKIITTIIEKELHNQIKLLKNKILDNLKCNNIKIDSDTNTTIIKLKNETNYYNLELDIYSSLSAAALYLLDDKYFNKINLVPYIKQCDKCNSTKSNLHTLHFKNNTYNIKIYLCDECFKRWACKCNNKRVKKCNNNKNSNH